MTEPSLSQQTSEWCRRAGCLLDRPSIEVDDQLALIRQAIALRRQWDRENPDNPQRLELLRLLPAMQAACQARLVESAGGPNAEFSRLVLAQLAEDDRCLAELLGNLSLAPETAAFALECFRDDLNWLSTLVAASEGQQSVDFVGRVLLEQETFERSLNAWDGENNGANHAAPPAEAAQSGQSEQSAQTYATDHAALRSAARRLREAALARQVESLLAQPEPSDSHGWLKQWQAASGLLSRLESEESRSAVQRVRQLAIQRWRKEVERLPPEQAADAAKDAAEDISDTAAESLTFLEELPLPRAVARLETLHEDASICHWTISRQNDSRLRSSRRAIRRQEKSLAGELQDRRLILRMEQLFGRRAVALLEKFILFLLVVFIVMLVTEAPLVHRYGQPAEAAFAWLDLLICAILLGEFGLKFFLASGKWLYLRRNWLTGLLPAIPVGFLAYATHVLSPAEVEGAEWIVALRLLRYLRLPQMARWLRVARPALRVVRLVGFLLRASDRLVRQLAPLLNRNLVVFEHASIGELETPMQTALCGLRERFHHRGSAIWASLPRPAQCRLMQRRIEDLTAMLSSLQLGLAAEPTQPAAGAREIPLDLLIARLVTATPAGVSQWVTRTQAQSVARWCRAFDVFGIRRLPLARDLAAAGRLADPYDCVARLSNRIGQSLETVLQKVYWAADLYGIVTAPQMVDSLGEWMVKGTSRPARRFLMFGALFLIVSLLAEQFKNDYIVLLAKNVQNLVGTPLILLGTVCMVPLLVGLWFRQIAGEASDFYHRVAEAQFLTATKQWKQRVSARYHAILSRRVLAPELEIVATAPQAEARSAMTTAAVERLWQDHLDAAPFHRGDTRSTMQLLGNLALLSLRQTRLRLSRRRLKMLERLDLSSARGSLRGPYLWFHFISRSLAQQTARLVVDYNAFVLPLDRILSAEDRQVRRYVDWLSKRQGVPVDELDLPPMLRARLQSMAMDRIEDNNGREPRPCEFQGTDFTAIHFLSADESLQRDVRQRYGDLVADLLHRDRRDNIRRVLRTYPFHRYPKEQRTFNPLTFYQRHLAGGWVLLFPLKLAGWALLLVARTIRLLLGFVRDVLHPTAAKFEPIDEPDPYAVAVRKIHHMRKPLFMQCLQLRAEFDPEYLGVMLPGTPGCRGASVPIEEDLAQIGAAPAVRQRFARLATERRRQLLELRYWFGREEMRGLCPESCRAIAIAYTIDYRKIRSTLEAARQLHRVFGEVEGEGKPQSRRWWQCFTFRPFGKARFNRMLDRLFAQPEFAKYAEHCEACRCAAWRDRARINRALKRLAGKKAGPNPVEQAREILRSVGRDPATWSQQLLVLRTVQTISVLDLQAYCDLVAELGEYGPASREPEEAMDRR